MLRQMSQDSRGAPQTKYPAGVLRAEDPRLPPAHASVERAREALRSEWPAWVRSGEAGARGLAALPPGEVEQWHAQEEAGSRHLRSGVAQVPPVPAPPALDMIYSYGIEAISLRRPKAQDLLNVLVLAARDLAVCPARWRTWSVVAIAYKQLFFLQDDKVAAEEDWGEKVWAWTRGASPSAAWAGRVTWLYGQARALNAMLCAHFDEALGLELLAAFREPAARATAEGPRPDLAGCETLAQHWLLRQLDLLTLLRCRQQSLTPDSLRTLLERADLSGRSADRNPGFADGHRLKSLLAPASQRWRGATRATLAPTSRAHSEPPKAARSRAWARRPGLRLRDGSGPCSRTGRSADASGPGDAKSSTQGPQQ